MRKNQGGFAVVEILIVVVVVAVLGFGGYYVYNSQKDKNKDSATSQQTSNNETSNQATDGDDAAPPDGPGIIYNDEGDGYSLAFRKESDFSKLPAGTPESFKTYFLEKLKNNKPDEFGCIRVYGISKVSKVNINGGAFPEKLSGEHEDVLDCGGGAPIIWVLAPNGKWDEETRNGIDCKSTNGGLVYVEFAEECAEPAGGSYIKNPNGSLNSL